MFYHQYVNNSQFVTLLTLYSPYHVSLMVRDHLNFRCSKPKAFFNPRHVDGKVPTYVSGNATYELLSCTGMSRHIDPCFTTGYTLVTAILL